MANRNGPRPTRAPKNVEFPARLRAWIEENETLLAAIARLRQIGDATAAVEAILDLRHITTARLSWELWEALVEGRGDDAEVLLLGTVPLALLDLARDALWGLARSTDRHLAVVRTKRVGVVDGHPEILPMPTPHL